jgi:hypothetical protein
LAGKTEVLKKNCPSTTLFTTNPYDLTLAQTQAAAGKPAFNCLSNGTAKETIKTEDNKLLLDVFQLVRIS